MTFEYRLRLNGKIMDSGCFVHLQDAVDVAKKVMLSDSQVLEVVDDGMEGQVVKYTRRGNDDERKQ